LGDNIPYTILKLIVSKIKNKQSLDSGDYKIFIKYKKIINMMLENENNR